MTNATNVCGGTDGVAMPLADIPGKPYNVLPKAETVVCADCGAECKGEGIAAGFAVTGVPRFPHARVRTLWNDGTNYGTDPKALPQSLPQGCASYFPAVYDVEGGESGPQRRICYACAAVLERETMIATGRTCLYLTEEPAAERLGTIDRTHVRQTMAGPHFYRYKLTNWPGNAPFPLLGRVRESHGYGFGRRYPVRTFDFVGPDGHVWSGRSAGDMDLARCKRTKRIAKGAA